MCPWKAGKILQNSVPELLAIMLSSLDWVSIFKSIILRNHYSNKCSLRLASYFEGLSMAKIGHVGGLSKYLGHILCFVTYIYSMMMENLKIF